MEDIQIVRDDLRLWGAQEALRQIQTGLTATAAECDAITRTGTTLFGFAATIELAVAAVLFSPSMSDVLKFGAGILFVLLTAVLVLCAKAQLLNAGERVEFDARELLALSRSATLSELEITEAIVEDLDRRLRLGRAVLSSKQFNVRWACILMTSALPSMCMTWFIILQADPSLLARHFHH